MFQSDLLKEYTATCVFLNRRTVSDGYGGYKYEWEDGATFDAILVPYEDTKQAISGVISDKKYVGVKVERNVPLELYSVFRCEKNGKTYRVEKPDSLPSPDMSRMNMKHVRIEEWVIPDE